MARSDRALPYFVGRFGYWHLHIAGTLLLPPGGTDQKTSSAQEAQEETRDGALGILEGHDDPQHPEYLPGLRIDLDAMLLSDEPDRRVRALRYWIMRDRLWYEYGEARRLLRALPDRQQQALEALNQEIWAPPSELWTWKTLLPRIAKDQILFRTIKECGPTRAGVAGNDPAIAQERLGVSQTEARTVYRAYQPQGAILLGRGMRMPDASNEWLSEQELLNQHGRVPIGPMGMSGTLDQFLGTVRVDTPHLPDWEAVYHWFAHALRNLARYRNADPPLPWPDNASSCQRRCLRELARRAP